MRIIIGSEKLNDPDISVSLLLDRVRGIDNTVKQTYIVFNRDEIDMQDPEVQKYINMHNRMVTLFFQRKWNDALVYMVMLGGVFNSRLNNFYSSLIARIVKYKEIPPPENWDGIYYQPDTPDK